MIELKCISDIYKDNPDGTSHVTKRGVVTKMLIDMRDVMGVMEIFDERGKIYKNQCAIHMIDLGRVFLKHKYEFIKELKEDDNKITKVSGYKTSTRKRRKAGTKTGNSKS